MNTLHKDRNILKRLVESYGKEDVLNFVNHLNEDIVSNPLDYVDSYDVFADDHIAEVFEKYNYDICVVANVPQIEKILAYNYGANVIERGNYWLIFDWSPEDEDTLRPEDLEPLIPYDDEHIRYDEVLRDWKMNREEYMSTLF